MLDSISVLRSVPIDVGHVKTDWVQVVVSGLLTAAAAFGAARFGAKVGGQEARETTIAVMREESLAEQRRRIDQLRHRLRYVLPRLGIIGDTAADPQLPLAFRPDLLLEVIELRETYERVSDSEVFFKDTGFVGRVRTFVTEAAITARQALADEQEMARLNFEAANGRFITAGVLDPIKSRLAQSKTRMHSWKGEADQYIRELEKE